jgi:pimeloyl-ACP methyl ester carboxylesterase
LVAIPIRGNLLLASPFIHDARRHAMSTLVPGDVETNGLKIHYYRTPDAPQARPTLVLLHGITDSGLCWPRVVKALEDQYDLVLPDARGHGQSDKPKAGYAPGDHAADVAGLIEALGLDRPVVIGHSMGGLVASLVAAQHPDLVRGAVLEDPAWLPDERANSTQRAARMAEWRKQILARQAMTPEELIAMRQSEQPKWEEEEFPDWAVAKMQVSPHVADFTAAMPPWREIARAIRCPTLLITANTAENDDAIVTPELAVEAQAMNPQIQVINVPDAGHNIRREDFEAYMTALRAFLAEVEQAEV